MLNMSIRRFLSIAAVTVSVVILSACGMNVASPPDTIKAPQDSQDSGNNGNQTDKKAEIMASFNDIVKKNSSPADIYKFITENIGNVEKNDANTMLIRYIEAQKKQLENYRNKLMTEDMNRKVNGYKFEDLVALKNIDESTKTFLQEAYNDGFKLFQAEGMSDFEIDFEKIDKNFSGYVVDDVADYIKIMSEQSRKHFAEDAALIISVDDLAARVITTENFIEKYKQSSFFTEINQWHSWYLTDYMIGLNNTPAYSYDTNLLETNFQDSYKNSIEKYKDSKLAIILKQYLNLIEKNDGKKTGEILNFVNKVAAI